ncbi:RNA polymerase sigma factor SigJ [Myceligenerans crystallogenes]
MTRGIEEGNPQLSTVHSERSRLLGVAYRLLGSASEAEDVTQETYLRWYRLTPAERDAVKVPAAWRTRVLTRICIDHLRSARARREVYVGEWLPEPLPDADLARSTTLPRESAAHRDPVERVTLDESVSMALLVVLEKMTPAERVSFVLHDVFQYSFNEIAEMVGRTPQACRQLASSARKRVQDARSVTTSPGEHRRVNDAFKDAWVSGNIRGLMALLNPDVTAVTDGGGVVSAAVEPLTGHEQVARFFVDVMTRQPDLRVRAVTVNSEPGLVGIVGDKVLSVVSTVVRDGRIASIWAVRNPEKLSLWETAIAKETSL